jgi:hypothetical protein
LNRTFCFKLCLTAAAALFLGACATPYGSTGLAGGYSQTRVNDELTKVDFYGNGFITADKIQMFALYRCAEVARDAKKPHFVLYDSLTAAARDLPAEQPRVGTLGGKPVAFALLSLQDNPRKGSQETSAVLARLKPLVEPPVQAERAKR